MIRIRWATVVALMALGPMPSMAAERVPPAAPGDTPTAQPEPYSSAFASFRPFDEARGMDWRKANEGVRVTGGHGGALADGDAEGADDKATNPHAGHHP